MDPKIHKIRHWKLFAIASVVLSLISTLALWFAGSSYSQLPFALGILIAFCIIGLREFRDDETPESYFFHERKMHPKKFTWTFVTANVGLFNSIFYTTFITYYYGPAGIIYPLLAWLIGMYWFAARAGKLRPYFKQGLSIHDFIGDRFGRTAREKLVVRRVTSIVSLTLLWASLSIEVKFAADLVTSLAGWNSAIGIATVIAATGTIYTYYAGYRGAVRTDVVQGFFMIVGALAILMFSVYLIITSPLVIGEEYSSVSGYLVGPYPAGLIAMVALLLPFQFCVMDMWQRCIAVANHAPDATDQQYVSAMKRYGFWHALLPFLILFAAWYALGMAAKWTGLTDNPELIVHSLLQLLMHSSSGLHFFVSLFVVGAFVGALLTTFDTYLIALTQGFMYDWYGLSRRHLRNVVERLTPPSAVEKRQFVSVARFWLTIFGISVISFAYFDFRLISFWVGMYSLMLGFFPVVYWGIEFWKPRSQSVGALVALVSIMSGFLVALSGGIAGTFFDFTIKGILATDLATIASPLVAGTVLVAGALLGRTRRLRGK